MNGYESERLVGTGGSNMFPKDKNEVPINPYLALDVATAGHKQSLSWGHGAGVQTSSSFLVRIIFQNPETGKNAKVTCNIPKDFTVNQLIHQALEQFNSQFKQQNMGISLRMDDGYYDLCPLDCETHNTGSPMLKHVLVFGYAESGVNNHDALNNCKVFELSLKSRKAMEVCEEDYRLGWSHSSDYRKHHSVSSSMSDYLAHTNQRSCLGECFNSCIQTLLCCCFYDMVMSMLSPTTNMDIAGGNYDEGPEDLFILNDIDNGGD